MGVCQTEQLFTWFYSYSTVDAGQYPNHKCTCRPASHAPLLLTLADSVMKTVLYEEAAAASSSASCAVVPGGHAPARRAYVSKKFARTASGDATRSPVGRPTFMS